MPPLQAFLSPAERSVELPGSWFRVSVARAFPIHPGGTVLPRGAAR